VFDLFPSRPYGCKPKKKKKTVVKNDRVILDISSLLQAFFLSARLAECVHIDLWKKKLKESY